MAARNRGDARAAYQLIRRAAELDPGNSEYARALETARRVYLDSTANARAAANSRVNDTSTGAARQAQQARDEIETAPKQTDEILKGASARPFDTTSNLAPTAPVVVFSKEPADLGPALAPHLGIALNLNDPKNQPVVEALQGVAYMLQVVRTSAVSGVRVDPAMLTQRVQKLNAALRKAEVPTVTTGQVEEAYSSYRLGVAEAPPDTPAGGTSQRNGQPQ